MSAGIVTERQMASGVDAAAQMRTPSPRCTANIHRYYNGSDICACTHGPDLSKRRMQ